jgi:hypothetical protein
MRTALLAALMMFGCSGQDQEPDAMPDPVTDPNAKECMVLARGENKCVTITCCLPRVGAVTIEMCGADYQCTSCGRTTSRTCVVNGTAYPCRETCSPTDGTPSPFTCNAPYMPC